MVELSREAYKGYFMSHNLVIKEFMMYIKKEVEICEHEAMKLTGKAGDLERLRDIAQRNQTLEELKDLMHQLLDKHTI